MRTDNQPTIQSSLSRYYEVWYLKLNLLDQKTALWLRMTLLVHASINKKIAETWAILFREGKKPIGFKETFPIQEFIHSKDQLQIQKCLLSDTLTQGVLTQPQHQLSWNLSFTSHAPAFHHVPTWLKQLGLNKSTVITPHPSLQFDGTLQLDQEEIPVQNAPGMQGHIFGSQQGLNWSWAHSNHSDDQTPFVFEGISARIKLAGMIPSPLLSAFLIQIPEGRFEFHPGLDTLWVETQPELLSWKFKLRKNGYRFEGLIASQVSDFAGVRYEDTDGSFLYCHNSKRSSLELKIYRGENLIRTVRSTRFCAYEQVTRKPNPEVQFIL